MLLEYNKWAILKVVNNAKLYSRYFCVLVLILSLVICGKQSNKKTYPVTRVNNGDFKKENDIGIKCKLNTAKYKRAIFSLDELTGQFEMDCNMGPNKFIPECNTTFNKSGPECGTNSVKYGLKCNMSFDKYGLDCNKGSDKFKMVVGPDQNAILNPNMSIKGHTTVEDKEGFKMS